MNEGIPSAFQGVNEAYDRSMSAYADQPIPHKEAQKYTYTEAENIGGDSLKNYTQSLADNSLRPLIENNNINPVQASTAKEQIGFNEPGKEQIIGNRYSEYGIYQIGKLEKKFNAMKHLYEEVMFAPENQKENVTEILKDYMEREYITPEEADLFSRVRNNMIEKKEGADVESIFLAIGDNSSRVNYLKREFASGRANPNLLRDLATGYGLPLSDSDKKELGFVS